MLDLNWPCSAGEVQAAQHRLARIHHPDLPSNRHDPEATGRMARINDASDVLLKAPDGGVCWA